MASHLRHLVVILGDQLNEDSSALLGFNPEHDAIWMAEVDEESTHVVSAKQRITVFLSAMRHFAASLRAKGWRVIYSEIDAPDNLGSLASELEKTIKQCNPKQIIMTTPGDWRVLQSIQNITNKLGIKLDIKDDTHFFSTVTNFLPTLQDANNCVKNFSIGNSG